MAHFLTFKNSPKVLVPGGPSEARILGVVGNCIVWEVPGPKTGYSNKRLGENFIAVGITPLSDIEKIVIGKEETLPPELRFLAVNN